MLADAFPGRAARQEDNRRRAAIVALVALLHVVLLYGLLHSINIRAVPKIIARTPITIWFPIPQKVEPHKQKPEELPTTEAPVAEPRTAPITVVPARPHTNSTDEDGIGKLGRYLDNCSSGNYGALSRQAWANCLGGMATRDHNSVQFSDIQTLWEKRHPPPAKLNSPEAHGFGECSHTDPKRLQGKPCFQWDGQAPTVQNGQQ
jgi:hypothetical protein